jgi:hypothetical protein
VLVTRVPWAYNAHPNSLARLGSGTDEEIEASELQVHTLHQPSIIQLVNVMPVQVAKSSEFLEWAEEVIQYLKEGKLPEDKKKSRQVQMRSSRYIMIGNTLYKRGYTLSLLKCILKADANYVLRDIHEGVCGSHTGRRMLAHKAIKSGYYWPHMNADSVDFVRNCEKYQRFAWVMKNPLEELSSISTPWPSTQWGVDLVGPMPKGKGGVGF